MKTLKKLLLLFLCLLALLTTAFFGWYFFQTKGVILRPEKLVLSTDRIEILDNTDKRIESAENALFHDVTVQELPEKVKFAFIDTEDKRFYSHHGFDYLRIGKAVFENLKSRSFKQGASTISQQLIKNTHLSHEKTLKRKLQEYKLTRILEKKYSKDEILCKYLSSIYFGHNCFGLRSAAAFYFNKTPSELTLSDGAILAGLVRSPNRYSPFKNPENCQRRKKVVLSLMYKQKHITKAEKAEAEKEPLPIAQNASEVEKSYFTRVFDELEKLAAEKKFRLGGKVRIRTYFDPTLQAELASYKQGETDCIFSVADNETLGIQAYVSTVGAPKRLPGSVIKPLLVYAPALEDGTISPATLLLDEKTDFGGYSPKNYGNSYHGYVSAREALSQSLNVPAVKILAATGVQNAVEYLQKLGLSVSEDDHSLALALGGMKNGFTTPQLLSAYATFANGGEYGVCSFIKEIFVNGTLVYKKSGLKKNVFSNETAYLTTDMLKTAAKNGTAKKLRSLPFPIAAKTGTNGTAKGNTDAYTLSYTRNHTVGVWFGNADNSPMAITGGGLCADLSYKIHSFLARRCIPSDFPKPLGVVSAALDKIEYSTTRNIILADENAPVQYRFNELFNEKFLPKTADKKFSNPFISTPSLIFDGKIVKIDFSTLPSYYQYEISRYDYATHTTVYKGVWQADFVDTTVQDGKTYQYTVTPFFGERKGESVILPGVTTKRGETVVPEVPPDITQEEWWNK